MSARPGPRGGYRVIGIPTAIPELGYHPLRSSAVAFAGNPQIPHFVRNDKPCGSEIRK
jgi:hypothetical protein